MTCCDIKASDLRVPVTILSRSEVADGLGGVTETWATLASIWGKVEPVSGRERAYAGRVEAQVDYRVFVRFAGDSDGNPAYTADHRIQFRNRTYGIEYVIDPDDRRAWLEIGARAAK